MKTASLKELKTELGTLHPAKVIEICMQLVKYKKENKDLLSYLLFDSSDEQSFIAEIKNHINEQFSEMRYVKPGSAKKTLRKILRITQKYIKYSGSKQTEIELLIHFCKQLKQSKIFKSSNSVVTNLYERQVLKINKTLDTLHEDLQYDYADEIKALS